MVEGVEELVGIVELLELAVTRLAAAGTPAPEVETRVQRARDAVRVAIEQLEVLLPAQPVDSTARPAR